MEKLFLERDLVELHHAQRAEQLRAREFRGAFGSAVFTLPATVVVAFICANYDGPERAGLLVFMFAACSATMAGAFWVARDTWIALRAVRWRVKILSGRVETVERCPSCGDEFDDTASQLRPIWSDMHDNIVCVTCKETI